MRIELDLSDELIGRIAQAVVDRMGSIKSATVSSGVVGCDLSAPAGHVRRGDEKQGHQRVMPQDGFLRLKEVLAFIPISKSTWYKGIADGRYPKPTKRLGPRIAVWDVRDIQLLLERCAD